MLIIWGSRKSYQPIGAIDAGCPNCRTQMGLYWAVRKFTLYWIPLFPMEKNYAMGCPQCKTFYALNQAAGAQMHSQITAGAVGNVSASAPMGIPPPNAQLYGSTPPPPYPQATNYPAVPSYPPQIPPPPLVPAAPPPAIPEMPPLPCKQCGGPLEKGAAACGYCGATAL